MLKARGCEKYQMSLDGMRETHDWFRKPGSFDLTLEKAGCLNRYTEAPGPVYEMLLRLVRDKDYFVLTTNVDHLFRRTGFDKKRPALLNILSGK